jgi:hypothetical protein
MLDPHLSSGMPVGARRKPANDDSVVCLSKPGVVNGESGTSAIIRIIDVDAPPFGVSVGTL